MTTVNEPTNCSSCGCSLEPDNILHLLKGLFLSDVSKIIVNLVAPPNRYRVTHRTSNEVHCLCPSCEQDIEDRLCIMDVGSFTCPHPGCRRLIISG